MQLTESGRARVWAAGLSMLAIVAASLVVMINPLEVALAYLVLLAAVIAIGLMTDVWGGMMASAIGVFAIVLSNYFAGIYPRESTVLNTAPEMVAFLLVGPVAGSLGMAIERVQRQAARWLALAEDRSVHDETFGTLQPRWARVRLEEETLRAANHGRPLTVALLLLEPGSQGAVANRAERVAALQALIRLARAATRPPAVVAHVGGDQVLVILPEHTLEQARQLAATLRQQVTHALYFPKENRDVQSLGQPLTKWGQLRIGLASLDSQDGTGETLLAQAKAGLE